MKIDETLWIAVFKKTGEIIEWQEEVAISDSEEEVRDVVSRAILVSSGLSESDMEYMQCKIVPVNNDNT